ncbi:uncharacterized protein VP01_441g3 [Puccinia sorghi]|uniref:Uncharacterized protein n=1 Tax=Puccinia sorghi TaxID=27349 RepID=A0A0L6URJ1_9BASI|nr:uncharacterized protein VP01_441g3 [Puccinia sorghi]
MLKHATTEESRDSKEEHTYDENDGRKSERMGMKVMRDDDDLAMSAYLEVNEMMKYNWRKRGGMVFVKYPRDVKVIFVKLSLRGLSLQETNRTIDHRVLQENLRIKKNHSHLYLCQTGC